MLPASLGDKAITGYVNLETIIDLVGHGLGIALLPETIADLRRPKISVCELSEPAICWELLVAHLRGDGTATVNAAAQAFLDLLTFQ